MHIHVHTQIEYFSAKEKKETLIIVVAWMKTVGHYSKQNKPDTEIQLSYELTYM